MKVILLNGPFHNREMDIPELVNPLVVPVPYVHKFEHIDEKPDVGVRTEEYYFLESWWQHSPIPYYHSSTRF